MRTRSWATLVGLSAVVAAGCTSGSGTAAASHGDRAAGSTGGSSEVPISGTSTAPGGGELGAPPAVRVAPAAPADTSRRPVIGRVWTTPALICDPVCHLPAGAGSLVLHVEVTGARQAEFFQVPTGTNTAGLRRSIGVDRDGRGGWSVRWAYQDEPLLAHVTVVVRGPGGTAEALAFTVTHPEPEPAAPVGGTLVRDWSTDPVSSPVDIIGATLVSVRSSARAGFDRIVWEFRGGLPGYDIGYGEAHIDAGGRVRSPLGDADLPVTFSAATAHDQAGRATVPDPNGGGLPVLREYRIVGDYHGYVFYALGLLRTVPFRVYELSGPDRLVVDFARR